MPLRTVGRGPQEAGSRYLKSQIVNLRFAGLARVCQWGCRKMFFIYKIIVLNRKLVPYFVDNHHFATAFILLNRMSSMMIIW